MNIRKLTREDFPDSPEWMDELFDVVNQNFEALKNEAEKVTHEDLIIKTRHNETQEVTFKKIKKPNRITVHPVGFFDSWGLKYEVARPYTVTINLSFGSATTEEREVLLRAEP